MKIKIFFRRTTFLIGVIPVYVFCTALVAASLIWYLILGTINWLCGEDMDFLKRLDNSRLPEKIMDKWSKLCQKP